MKYSLSELIYELMICVHQVHNIEAYKYLKTIYLYQKSNPLDTEKQIVSPNFINQRCFTDSDRKRMVPIIREYKLSKLI